MQTKENRNNDSNELEVNFIANAGIKDIVGRGLIYNDNVAIIELIKNSKDANSSKVILEFNDITNKNSPLISEGKIIIKDFGHGMTKSDIKDKWLNIAYSEKKHSKIKEYAGNKGVGRFSCDRLGSYLELYTKSKNDDFLKLSINWEDFENKGKSDVISDISLKIEILEKAHFLEQINEFEFGQGTVLIISKLRSDWPEQKLKKLIAEIEKFSPSLDNDFQVFFKSNSQFEDKELIQKKNKKINNNILEKLAFKTTYIKSFIDKTGQYIETFLYFQGELVYKYKANNPYKLLKNISVEFHYLDSLSKSYFTKNFGIKPNSYGSIFLFYNNFRISPYGNEKNDWLGLDQRKSQGTSRNFGTRELIGRIDVTDHDETFAVITSREGLVHNRAYFELVAFDPEEKALLDNGKNEYGYVTTIIRQLESFVVKGTDWNRLEDKWGKLLSVSSDDVLKNPERFYTKELSVDLIKKEVLKIKDSLFDVLDFKIDSEILKKIQSINHEKYSGFLKDFIEKTEDKSLEDLSPQEKGIVKTLIQATQKKVNEANFEVKKAKEETKKVTKNLEIEKKKQAYLLATRRTLSKDADGLIHTIKINNAEISTGIDNLIDLIQYDEIDNSGILRKLSNIRLYALKTLKMAEIAIRSDFDKEIDIRNINIVQYIKEYINIYDGTFESKKIKIKYDEQEIDFVRSISILNLSIVLDNLISNAIKWSAKNLYFKFSIEKTHLRILISDDGTGLSNLFINSPESMFDLGSRDIPPEEISGSGIGLFYSRQLLNEMNAEIMFLDNNYILSGACFEVTFK
ncbi:ATP-binding protein [Acinetobacter haemolyticus]|nr:MULTISPECIES: ATP-binding protein [Acinetobacter]MCU4408634.1 ATP-binding protein [Acinetobacter junii]MEB8379556.1 ATP-binding protein [Acinetobacter junii]NAS04942.1 ATP-binding protein [Acinetobacter haemolyticus]TID67115.1 ATP-binding protein [Acinetobacter junii]